MITDMHTRLLTAYVDGELSPRHRRGVKRLLERSPEARQLLEKLLDDAGQVRTLPRQYPEAGFSERILRAAARQPIPVRRPLRAAQRTIPAWVGLAAAAAIVLVVGGGTYLYFGSTIGKTSHAPLLAQGKKAVSPSDNGLKNEDANLGSSAHAKREPMGPFLDPKDGRPSDTPDVTAKREFVGPEKPAETPAEAALTAPIETMEMFQPKVADVSVSLILKMHELDSEKLKAEVKKDKAYRLEMPCGDTAKAFPRIEAAFKAVGATLVIDQIAQNRLKAAKSKTNYVFYADDLTPEELTALVQNLSAEDVKAEAKHKGDGLFGGLVVNRMSDADHKELKELLGVDPRQPATKATPVDPKKPLSETTGDQVAQTVVGGKTVAKGTDRLAMALAYNPERPRPNSAEIKRFLEGRKAPRTGTLQVVLVVRGT
jgi:hypothetical protein